MQACLRLMLYFLKIWSHFPQINSLCKITRPRERKTLAPLVQALHTHNACDGLFCWFFSAAGASDFPRSTSALKGWALPNPDSIIKHRQDRPGPLASFIIIGEC